MQCKRDGRSVPGGDAGGLPVNMGRFPISLGQRYPPRSLPSALGYLDGSSSDLALRMRVCAWFRNDREPKRTAENMEPSIARLCPLPQIVMTDRKKILWNDSCSMGPLKTVPGPSVVWRNGLIVRTFVLYLVVGILAVQTSMMPHFLLAVLIIEVGCYWLSRLAKQNGSVWCLFLLTYLSVGDIVWVAGALAIAAASGIVPAWGFAFILAIWLASICVNLIVASHSTTRRQIVRTDEIVAEAEHPGTSKRYRQIDLIISRWLSTILIVVGLFGIVVAYIINQEDWFLVMLSVSFLGLACGFSPQLRPLLMVLLHHIRTIPFG